MRGILSSSNKRGWIRIVEAFIAVLLITGALLIVINKGYLGNKDISEKVYESQISILREIELDSHLRFEILNIVSVPVLLNNKLDTWGIIDSRKPDYLECSAMVCELNKVCALDPYPIDAEDIYVQSVAIATEGDSSKFRQLKLFCWRK